MHLLDVGRRLAKCTHIPLAAHSLGPEVGGFGLVPSRVLFGGAHKPSVATREKQLWGKAQAGFRWAAMFLEAQHLAWGVGLPQGALGVCVGVWLGQVRHEKGLVFEAGFQLFCGLVL